MATSPHDYYLNTLGITRWQKREAKREAAAQMAQHVPVAQLDWQALQERVAECRECPLHEGRTQTVFGVGSHEADLLIVGEAPGFYEDQKGEPFVGRAGQLLTSMLFSIGLAREQVYIANVLKCRPPQNRDPRPEEVVKCTQYLERQVALLQPKLILALGRHAAHYLLNTTQPLASLRGHVHYFRETNVPLIVSYHPAYLLRSPRDKRKAFLDWQKVSELLGQSSAHN